MGRDELLEVLGNQQRITFGRVKGVAGKNITTDRTREKA